MTKYESKMNYERTWKRGTPTREIRDLLGGDDNLSITMEKVSGNSVTWRKVSRNEHILEVIRESLHRMKNSYSVIGEEAQVLYDKLEQEGYLNP